MGDEKDLEVYAIGAKRAAAVIRYAGAFDMLNLLGTIKNWYAKRYYNVADKEHSEAVKSSGKDLIIEFEGVRDVTEYVQFKVNVKIVILRLIDVLVENPEGKEKKQQAEVEIGIRSWLVKNYKKTFKGKENSKIQEFSRQVYERFVAKKHFDDIKRKLVDETLILMEEVKESLNVPKK